MTAPAPDEYTPTTEQVRIGYKADTNRIYQRLRGEEFDRWLAQHDAEVREKVAQAIRSTPAVQMEGVATGRSQDYYDGVADGIYGALGIAREVTS